MHILYLDDSGSVSNPREDYLVLGGVSVFEAQVHHLTQKLDHLAEGICPQDPHGVEFHASEIFSRRRNTVWGGLERPAAQLVIKSVLDVLRESHASVRAFACAVHKASFPEQNSMAVAFEEIVNRFDLYLRRLNNDGDQQRGLLIIDECSYAPLLRNMTQDFRAHGTQSGAIRYIADITLCVDSHASRVVQLADHVAYAVFRRYNAKDTHYFDVIASKFDQADGVIHGLSHKQKHDPKCMCLACITPPPIMKNKQIR